SPFDTRLKELSAEDAEGFNALSRSDPDSGLASPHIPSLAEMPTPKFEDDSPGDTSTQTLEEGGLTGLMRGFLKKY
ncbi:hypothetical protein AAF712_016797, partial [Marasmius tenuissimus]